MLDNIRYPATSQDDQHRRRDIHHPVLRADPGRGHLGGAQEAARE